MCANNNVIFDISIYIHILQVNVFMNKYCILFFTRAKIPAIWYFDILKHGNKQLKENNALSKYYSLLLYF